MTENLLIIGTGALATLFAARLSAAAIQVTMLGTWTEGLDALEKIGAVEDTLPPRPVQVARNPQECRGVKVALVLVKSWQTERAARQLQECLDQNGFAVSLQNGLGNSEVLEQVLGKNRVGSGITTLGATLTDPGRVHFGGEGQVILENHPRIQALERIFKKANINVEVVLDALPDIWGKLVLNSAINPLSAILGVKNGALIESAPARELLFALARETTEVASAYGIRLPFENPAEALENVAEKSADNISSMLQDIQRGSQTEIDSINGKIVQLAKAKGVPVPYNQAVTLLVKSITNRGKINS